MLTEIKYDNITFNRQRARDNFWTNCITTHNNSKTSFIYNEDWLDDEEDLFEPIHDEAFARDVSKVNLTHIDEVFYKCWDTCTSIPGMSSFHNDWWYYNDPKNKTMRAYRYPLKTLNQLVIIQNFVWTYLQDKKWKKYTMSYVLLIQILNKDTTNYISQFLDEWTFLN